MSRRTWWTRLSPAARAVQDQRCRHRDGPELATLRTQRLATAPVPGTMAGTTSTSSAGTALGKPRYAKLLRQLPVERPGDPATVLAEAVRLARADGWVAPPDSPPAQPWLLDKTLSDARLHAGLSMQNVDGHPTLVIDLTYHSGP